MLDGHLGKCIACTRRDVQINRERGGISTPRMDEAGTRLAIGGVLRLIRKDRARNAVSNAIRDGRLRDVFVICGDVDAEAHQKRRGDVGGVLRRRDGQNGRG